MDAECPAFPDETFDVVVSRNLTWTLPHPERAYRQWLRILKPGGILLNYDAEHARYHLSSGLEGEKAHEMLSRGQMDECLEIVNIALERLFDRGITDWGKIKSEIKDSLNDFLWKKTKRNPMILPIIMEVDV